MAGLAGTFANLISVASGNTGIAAITDSAASTFSGAITLNTHALSITPAASNITLSGGVTGTGNLTLATSGAGTITMQTGAMNNSGTITNSGTGVGSTLISAGVGSNVTSLTESSATSAFTVSGALTVNASGTTLIDGSGAALLTLTGGTTGTGNLTLQNNSATANNIILSGTSIDKRLAPSTTLVQAQVTPSARGLVLLCKALMKTALHQH